LFTFRFTVQDPKGNLRRGKIEAKSESHARKAIEARKYQVVSLEPFSEGELEFKEPKGRFKGLKFDPPAQTDYIPTLSERVSDFFQNESLLWKGVAFFCSLGLIVFVLSLSLNGFSESERKPAPLHTITIFGQLSQRNLPLQESDKLIVNFPDLPLRKSFPASSVTEERGAYQLRIEFESTKTPVTAEVILQSPHRSEARTASFPLSGQPLVGKAPKL